MADLKISALPVAGVLTNAELLAIVQGGVTVQTTLSTVLAPYLTTASAAAAYQPKDADLTAIAALTGSSGFLKTNGAGVWTVDTNTYLTTASASSTYLALAGGTMVGNINGTTPTEITYLSGATSNLQTQINNLASGLSWKLAVRVATTANITLSGTQTIDGVAVIAGDRVLVKNQSTAANNGLYLCAAGAWTRTTDATTGGSGSTGILGATVVIEEGTVNADTIYTCSTDAPITIGVTSLSFSKTSATTYTGSNGITLTSNNFTLDNSYFSGEATISAGVITLTNASVIGKVLTGYVSGAGTVSATDSILQAIQKINGNVSTLYVPYTGATGNVTLGTNNLTGAVITATAQNTTNTVNTLIVKDSSAANAFGIFNDGHMALGATNPIAATFRISANHTGGATGTGIFLQGTIQTDVTSAMRMVLIQPTIGAALALTTYSGIIIGTPGLGAGASNTTCNQLTIQELTSGAVGSALIMQVASGTNKFNINASGTALNFLQGDLGIGDSGGTSRFIVTGNKSSSAWGTAGIQANFKASSYTDTSSSGTVAEVAITSHNIGTLVASSSTTYTNAYGTYLVAPGQGSSVVLTNTFALGILAGTSTIKLGQLTGDSTSSAIYMNQATPSAINYAFNSDGSTLSVNGTTVRIKSANNSIVSFTASAASFSQVIKPATGTTTIAPLQFTSGTNLTTAAAGVMEYNGTNLFFTRTGTTRENVLVAVDNAATPTTSVGVGIVNYYGAGATNFLGDPNRWLSVNVLGSVYKIPLYT